MPAMVPVALTLLLVGQPPPAWLEEARALLPGLARLQTEPTPPDFRALGEIGARLELFVPSELLPPGEGGRVPPCRKLNATVGDGVVAGDVRLSGGSQQEVFVEVRAGETVRVLGPHARARGCADGRAWEKVVTGPFAREESALLEAVLPDRVEYGLLPVRVEVRCASRAEEACGNDDGSTGVCTQCRSLDVALRSERTGRSQGFHTTWTRTDAGEGARPRCDACPPDALAPGRERLDRLLRDRELYAPDPDPWPVLFVRRSDCEAAVRARR